MKGTVALLLASPLALPGGALAEAWPETALDGASAYEEGRFDEAAEAYERAVLAGETRPEIVYNLGAARYRAAEGDSAGLAAALADFRRAGASAGAGLRNDAGYNAATMQALLGDLEAAIDGYKDVLRENPADNDARYNLELLQRMLSQAPPQEQPRPGEGEEQESSEGDRNEAPEETPPRDREPPEPDAPAQGPEQPQSGEEEAPPEPEPGDEQGEGSAAGEGSPPAVEPQPPPEEAPAISREEALRQLDKLEEAERELLRQLLLQRQRRVDVEKDW